REEAIIEDTLEIPSITKTEAYDRARVWMVANLKSGDQQIFSDDENKGSLIGTGNLLLADKGLIKEKIINYEIAIFFKDGRYKYTISKLVYSWVSNSLDQQQRTPHVLNLNKDYKKIYSKKTVKKNKLFLEIDRAFKKLTDDL